jgi:hypothetical protein
MRHASRGSEGPMTEENKYLAGLHKTSDYQRIEKYQRAIKLIHSI